jgi:hypothetical protein
MKQCPYCGSGLQDGVAIERAQRPSTTHAESVHRVECPECERQIDAFVSPVTGSVPHS